MKTWKQLFIRQGFNMEEMSANRFDCKNETEDNLTFLMESLEKLQVPFSFHNYILTLNLEPVKESDWLGAVDFNDRGHGDYLWFRSECEEPKVRELDTYISGIIRQLNRLGLLTEGSCDGHGRGFAFVQFKREFRMEKIEKLFHIIAGGKVRIRNQRTVFCFDRTELPDLAEKMQVIEKDWLDENEDFLKKQLFFNQVEQLLSINGASGEEKTIREFVFERLAPFVDHITVDENGNLLAQKKYRSGHGPTILLNAHLDTVEPFEEGRTIIKSENIWSSSNGILGADDRAGVAVLLETARNLYNSQFSGTVKYIFTVEEEIGLVGARGVNDFFLWDVDAAIVTDRRGNGDIVTSCGGVIPFCHENYGQFIENIAGEKGLNQWKCTSGGLSDTKIWADHGIQSVNLSVGYNHEHSELEFLDIDACFQTVQLLQVFFEKSHELRRVLNSIRGERVS
jgi:tripeptide aminopeptidase